MLEISDISTVGVCQPGYYTLVYTLFDGRNTAVFKNTLIVFDAPTLPTVIPKICSATIEPPSSTKSFTYVSGTGYMQLAWSKFKINQLDCNSELKPNVRLSADW